MVVMVALVLVLVVLGFVGYPLLLKQESGATKGGKKRKDRTSKPGPESSDVDGSLRQLEMDFRSGAISEDDYIELKVAYERGRRQGPAGGGQRGEAKNRPKERDAGGRARTSRGSGQGTCPACGSPVKESNKFCPECGRPMGKGR